MSDVVRPDVEACCLRPEWADGRKRVWHDLMKDAWLRGKVARDRRLYEHLQYLDHHVPEIWEPPAGYVVDLGPGPGELLELCRAAGHKVLGVDAAAGDGGMGNPYLLASRLMHERQALPVIYQGAWHFFDSILDGDNPLRDTVVGQCRLVNSRGSLEQIFHHCMVGEPHHLHHCAAKLFWREDGDTIEAVGRWAQAISELLAPGGCVVVHTNGSGNNWYIRRIMLTLFSSVGLVCDKAEERCWRWRQPQGESDGQDA